MFDVDPLRSNQTEPQLDDPADKANLFFKSAR